jgi:hypothetical protein
VRFDEPSLIFADELSRRPEGIDEYGRAVEFGESFIWIGSYDSRTELLPLRLDRADWHQALCRREQHHRHRAAFPEQRVRSKHSGYGLQPYESLTSRPVY